MKSKILSLSSVSLLVFSAFVTEGQAKGLIAVDSELLHSPRVYHREMPERYAHLDKVRKEALESARVLAQREKMGRRHVGFRNTLEIHTFNPVKESQENFEHTSPASHTVVSSKAQKPEVPNLKFDRIGVATSLTTPEKTLDEVVAQAVDQVSRHSRRDSNIDSRHLLGKSSSPRARKHLNNLVADKDVKAASERDLKMWAKLGHAPAQHELSTRLMKQGKLISALKWTDRAIKQGDKQAVVLQKEILGQLEQRYERFRKMDEFHRKQKFSSEMKEPCLPARVPLFPFSDENPATMEGWKKKYMQASLMLSDDPFSLEARDLLLVVLEEQPTFKDPYVLLYLAEKKTGNKKVALAYLEKAAAGSQGLAVAQYQMGVELLGQGKKTGVIKWFKRASGQGYWLADKKLMEIYSGNMGKIEKALNAHKSSVKK